MRQTLSLRAKILSTLQEQPSRPLDTTHFMEALGLKHPTDRRRISQSLHVMSQQGRVVRAGRGTYALPTGERSEQVSDPSSQSKEPKPSKAQQKRFPDFYPENLPRGETESLEWLLSDYIPHILEMLDSARRQLEKCFSLDSRAKTIHQRVLEREEL